jgi:hypothetical protein
MLRTLLFAFLAPVVFLAGCARKPAEQTSKAWNDYVGAFLEATFTANPDLAVYQGRHDFDGKLPDWSPAGIQREIDRLRAERVKAAAFDAATLDSKQRFERDYMVAVIDGRLFWLASAEWPFRNPYYYSTALDPNVYVSREYAPLAERLKAYTVYARAVPAAMLQIRANLRTPLPKSYVEIGHTTFGGFASYYEKDVPAVFAGVQDPVLQKAFRDANAGAVRAARDMDAWFTSQEKSATDAFALGADRFSEMLRATESVDLPLDRLEQAGRQDLDRNLAALKEACAQFAPGQPIPKCIQGVKANKPEGGTVEAARRQLVELKKFVADKQLVSIPGTEEAKVDESPPYNRWNFAYIDIPGPYEKNVPSIYYVAPPDPKWTKAERDAYIRGRADLLFTSAHEVWPGHFLQFLHANRAASKFGQVFVGYAYAEGWGHYAEELMWESGLGGDPETHIGQLLNALLRNVRYLSAIGMHAHGMTMAESEKMFQEEGYQDPGTARQQARRGTFDPAYLNYLLGKLMIRKLRSDWTASRGGKAAWREFHDQFLSFGGPPIPLVRKAMLGPDAGPPL